MAPNSVRHPLETTIKRVDHDFDCSGVFVAAGNLACHHRFNYVFSGVLLGSLAWAGHGQESSPWHLSADVLHLLVAGLWPSGLLPLALVLKKLRPSTALAQGQILATLVRRFSALSLASVSLLTLTGLANSWYLVGSFSNLTQPAYGRWLMTKLILFGVIITFGAINLLRLKPRIENEALSPQRTEASVAQPPIHRPRGIVLCHVHRHCRRGAGHFTASEPLERVFKLRSVAVPGRSNVLTKLAFIISWRFWLVKVAAPGDGRAPDTVGF